MLLTIDTTVLAPGSTADDGTKLGLHWEMVMTDLCLTLLLQIIWFIQLSAPVIVSIEGADHPIGYRTWWREIASLFSEHTRSEAQFASGCNYKCRPPAT